MIISIELNQTWKTTREASDYFQLLANTLARIGGDFPDSPKEWYLHFEDLLGGEHKVELTYL